MSELREVVVKRENGWEDIEGFKGLKNGDIIKVDGKDTEWAVESDPYLTESGFLGVNAREIKKEKE